MGLWVWGAPYERANATVHSLSDLPLWRTGADAFAAAALNELDWRWQRAAYASPLRVLVLGGSVTGGCGATSACHAGAVSTACSIETSWGLILSDSLQQSLRGVEVHVGLFGKSAVDASYFEQCPSLWPAGEHQHRSARAREQRRSQRPSRVIRHCRARCRRAPRCTQERCRLHWLAAIRTTRRLEHNPSGMGLHF